MSEVMTNRQPVLLLFPGCPLWAQWQEAEGCFRISLRNVSWCRVVRAQFEIDGATFVKDMDVAAMENIEISFSEITAMPKRWVISEVLTEDDICWRLKAGSEIPLDPPVTPDSGQEGYKEFKEAWKYTSPLYQPELHQSYWRCGCGQANDLGRIYCGNCRKGRDWVVRHLNGTATLNTLKEKQQQSDKEQEYLKELGKKRRLKKKFILKLAAIAAGAAAMVAAVTLVITQVVLPARRYAEAEAFLSVDRYYEAYSTLSKIPNYKDAAEKMVDITRKLSSETSLSAGYRHIVKNNNTGTVSGTGYVFDGALLVDKWNGVRAVAAGKDHSLGLHYDGTVIAVGNKDKGACEVLSWANIVQIGAGYDFSVGLQKDGKVIATGKNNKGQCDAKNWSDITAISVGNDFTVGLKSDGTVVATGNNKYGQCNVSGWKDIIYIAAGTNHTVGIRKDGSVVAVGRNTNKACDVSDWEDVIAVTAGDEFTVGIKTDGTLVAVGQNDRRQIDIKGISDAIGVVAGPDYTVVMLSNGTLQFLGTNEEGEGMITQWMLHQ